MLVDRLVFFLRMLRAVSVIIAGYIIVFYNIIIAFLGRIWNIFRNVVYAIVIFAMIIGGGGWLISRNNHENECGPRIEWSFALQQQEDRPLSHDDVMRKSQEMAESVYKSNDNDVHKSWCQLKRERVAHLRVNTYSEVKRNAEHQLFARYITRELSTGISDKIGWTAAEFIVRNFGYGAVYLWTERKHVFCNPASPPTGAEVVSGIIGVTQGLNDVRPSVVRRRQTI